MRPSKQKQGLRRRRRSARKQERNLQQKLGVYRQHKDRRRQRYYRERPEKDETLEELLAGAGSFAALVVATAGFVSGLQLGTLLTHVID